MRLLIRVYFVFDASWLPSLRGRWLLRALLMEGTCGGCSQRAAAYCSCECPTPSPRLCLGPPCPSLPSLVLSCREARGRAPRGPLCSHPGSGGVLPRVHPPHTPPRSVVRAHCHPPGPCHPPCPTAQAPSSAMAAPRLFSPPAMTTTLSDVATLCCCLSIAECFVLPSPRLA